MGESGSSVAVGSSGAVFCCQCGHKNFANFNFCQKCGEAGGAAGFSRQQVDPIKAEVQPSMTLLKAVVIYAIGLGLNTVAFRLDVGAGFFLYLVIGLVMTRFVMGGLIEWHPHYNTLNNVVAAKLKMLALWPIQMPFLLAKLLLNRVM